MHVDSPVIPWNFIEDNRSEHRLIGVLRDAARTRNPIEILARAAANFLLASRSDPPDVGQIALATALADLSVTGRASFRVFKFQHENGWDLAALKTAAQLQLAADPATPTDAELSAAIDQALDRAYDVAWALCGPARVRAELRPRLGWIAVSAEDDTAHRPVNIPAPPYEEYEIDVASGGVSVATRLFIASAAPPASAPLARTPRSLPPTPPPGVPADHEILLFLHGHSSGAEEALDIIPHLLEEGLKRNKNYSVIAFDLPNNGYSETFDHTEVAPTTDSTFPRLPTDNGPIATPIFDFIEDFVVAFVDRLDDVALLNGFPSIKDRIAAVIGGSLGGNLGLRLGRRDPMPDWLNRAIVAWSPASVWQPFAQESPKWMAPARAFDRCDEDEAENSRAQYFALVYDKEEQPGIVKQQTKYWYRKGWEHTELQIAFSRRARREIYNPAYRRWHWRVAGEQLIYSHWDNVVHGDSTTPVRITLNRVRTLLAAGDADNHLGTKIYKNTAKLARAMSNAGGRMLQVRDAGHSIHFEHPAYFANAIVKFLNARVMQVTCITREEGRIRRIGGTNRRDNSTFNISVEECMTAIGRGDEFFVRAADGTLANVSVHGKGESRFIWAARNSSESDNLLSLPDC